MFSSEKHQTLADAEGRVPDKLLEDMGAEHVGKNWLLANLGRPASVSAINATVNVYTWRLTRTEHRQTHFLLVYNSDKSYSHTEYLHVVCNGNEVFKHWLDKDEDVDALAVLNRREISALDRRRDADEGNNPPSLEVPRNVQAVTTVIRPSLPQVHPAPSDADISL